MTLVTASFTGADGCRLPFAVITARTSTSMGRAASGTCAPPFVWYSARLSTKDSQLSSSSPWAFHDTSASWTVSGQCQASVA